MSKVIAPLYECPVKGCKYTREYISVIHFKNAHGFTGNSRAEAIKQFGAPIERAMDPVKLQENVRMNEKRVSLQNT